jgi:argininosuccinate lyase
MDAVSDRDWSAEFLFAAALLGVHLSRLGEDLVLFTSREMGFVRLGDGHSTGSSLMPQKRNPDAAELVRGKAAGLVANLGAVLTLLKGLPTGYNRDLQEEKGFLFASVDTLLVALPAVAGAVRDARFQPDRIRRALGPELLTTDLADYLVQAGVPFRKSHEVLGALVREAEDRGVPLPELPDAVFRKAHPAFTEGFRSVLDWERSVEARDATGGTSRRSVRAQMKAIREALQADS